MCKKIAQNGRFLWEIGKKPLTLQVKRKGTKKSVKITLIVVASFVALLATPVLLLHIDSIQNRVVRRLTDMLEQSLHTTVSIGHVDVNLLGKVSLQQIYIADRQGDTLLAADELNGRMAVWRLLHNEIVFPATELVAPHINIHIDKDGGTNLDFLSEMLPDTTHFDGALLFDRVEVCHGRLTIANEAIATRTTQAAFDARDISIDELNVVARFRMAHDKQITAGISEFSFVEKSGFQLDNITASATMNDTMFIAENLNVSLPHSFIDIDSIAFDFDDLKRIVTAPNTVQVRATLHQSNIHFPDLEAFVPAFGRMRNRCTLSGTLSGTIGDMHARRLSVKYGRAIAFDGDFDFEGLPDLQNTFADARFNEISFTAAAVQDLVANITQHPVVLPQEIHRLGKCRYSGRVKGFPRNLALKGRLATNAGTINTDVNVQVTNNLTNLELDGCIRTKRLQLGLFTPAEAQLGDIAFDLDTKLHLRKGASLKAQADLIVEQITFRDYTYENIKVAGNYASRAFVGQIGIDDPNLKLDFDGKVDWNAEEYIFNFAAAIDHFRPYALHLIDSNPNLAVSVGINSNFNGPDIDRMAGNITLENLFLDNDEDFYLQELALTSNIGRVNSLTLRSNLVNGYLKGNYEFTKLPKSIVEMAKRYFPILGKADENAAQAFGNAFDFGIEAGSTEDLAKALNFGWFTPETATIDGRYDDIDDNFYLAVGTSKLRNLQNGRYDDLYVVVDNKSKRINCELGGKTITRKNDTITCVVALAGRNDSVSTHLQWSNTSTEIMHGGEFLLRTHLYRSDGRLHADTQVLPTQIMLQNTPFDVSLAEINTDFEKVTVENLKIESEEQHIFVDGTASKAMDDIIDIDLRNIDLAFISSLIPPGVQIEFNGNVSGRGKVQRAFDMPIVVADVSGDAFSFNDTYLGEIRASSWWENDEKEIAFAGTIISDARDSTAVIHGGYFIPNDSLDILIHAEHINIKFIEPFMSMILQDLRGTASGDVHVFGYTRTKQVLVTLEAMAEEAQASIDFMGATFFFNDSIRMTPTEIIMNDIDVLDTEGNHAKLNGIIKHKYFEDIDYRIDISCQNFKALNTTAKDNDTFYGTAYATGTAIISGTDEQTNIFVNATTEKNTKLVVPIGASVAAENSFITFVSHDAPEAPKPVIDPYAQAAEKKESVLHLNLLAHVTPNAEVQIYIDPKSGDVLKATGEGDLRMEYNDQTDEFKLYGNYEIEQGSYRFSFQEAIRKEFKVKQGGTVGWSGDPVNPQVNIDGYYQLNASLLDVLDQSYLQSSNRTTVPVQCLLNLTGDLSNPNIKFGLNLPTSDEELNRALQTTISTDEMMTREIIYLLVLGKFFTPETMKSTGVVFSQGDLLAVASSTVSAQLNNWASQMFENWNFGVNFRSTDLGESTSNEYEFNFLYTPNNRISINGNVGYRDDNLSASKFIGDFDFEYKLIQSGKLSAKAYTHTNDYKEFKTGLTTQGIGLVYRENFDSGKDLINNWKQSIAESKKERIERKAKRAERKAQRQAEKEREKAEKAEKNAASQK